MPDNSKTRKAVADANDALSKAKKEEEKTGKPVSEILKVALKKAIAAYDAPQ